MYEDYILYLAENTSVRINLLYGGGVFAFLYAYWNSFLSGGDITAFILYFLLCCLYFVIFAAAGVGLFTAIFYYLSWQSSPDANVDWTQYIDCRDPEINQKYKGKKIPMEEFVESFLNGKCDFKQDLHETLLNHRHKIFRFVFTPGHLNFFYKKFMLQTFGHTAKEDATDVCATYNLGNDFYNAFLGSSMVYTCAIFNDPAKESLEEGQRNKLDFVCKKVEMKKGDRHLDIGCGWGTMVAHAAKNYGTNSLGITIAREQIEWGEKQINDLPSEARARAQVKLQDYRDIPTDSRFDKITCLEMAEHVGVKNFQKFCRQLYGILEDDGLLYIQMCGLRPHWHYEDLVWGLFMAKYIFPGADASCPASWVGHQLENAGFEVHSIETVSYHYAITIKRWYDSWVKNKDKILKAGYPEKLWRLYYLFLGWSVIIGMQGSSACYQIVAHKNTMKFDRAQFVGKVGVPTTFVGTSEPVTKNPTGALNSNKSS